MKRKNSSFLHLSYWDYTHFRLGTHSQLDFGLWTTIRDTYRQMRVALMLPTWTNFTPFVQANATITARMPPTEICQL